MLKKRDHIKQQIRVEHQKKKEKWRGFKNSCAAVMEEYEARNNVESLSFTSLRLESRVLVALIHLSLRILAFYKSVSKFCAKNKDLRCCFKVYWKAIFSSGRFWKNFKSFFFQIELFTMTKLKARAEGENLFFSWLCK